MVTHTVVLILITIITSVVGVQRIYLGNYEEGRKCGRNSVGNGYFGKCLKIKDCLNAFNEYKNNQSVLQVCGYSVNKDPKEDLICCSMDDLEKSKPNVSLLKLKRTLEYNECVERYLEFRPSIPKGVYSAAGAQPAIKQDFPNMVAVGWTQDDKSIEYNCGGSVITELFIVTAAHCSSLFGYLYTNNNKLAVTNILNCSVKPDVVRIGDLDLISDNDNEHLQQLNVASIIKHPDYSFRSTYNDIALIKVDREIK